MPVVLSEIPATPAELEDYVAALFLAAGHYVDKNITEQNVLELDIVATDYRTDPPLMILSEAKSGDWGFGDLFKVVGWMRYLHLEHGALFCKEVPADKDFERVQEVFEPLGVTVVNLRDFSDADDRFMAAGLPTIADPAEVTHWRWVHTVERTLLGKLITLKRSTSSLGPAAVLEYHGLVNNGIFFERSVRDRLMALYAAYQSHPKLALGYAREIDGGTFDPQSEASPSDSMSRAMRSGEHLLIQGSFYVEHRARLAILKAAIDFAVKAPKVVDKLVGRTSGFRRGVPSLPGSFVDGLRWLTEQPTFQLYARLWQTFLWSWGGFYLKDREDDEFSTLAEQSGVPRAEIDEALTAFDRFFPTTDSWFVTPGMTHCRMIKMMPWPFMGLGAYHRLTAYLLTQYTELHYGDYTVNDLAKWHNHVAALLS